MSKNNQYKYTNLYIYDHKLRFMSIDKGLQKISERLKTTPQNIREGINSITPIVNNKREFFFVKTRPIDSQSVYVNLSEKQLLEYKHRMNQLGYSNFFEI